MTNAEMINPFLLVALFGMGFGIGLSGALIPGPLLGYTITRSVRYGAKTGILVIVGHACVELGMVLLLAMGFLRFLKSPVFSGIIGISGSVVLFLTAISIFKQRHLVVEERKEKSYGPVISGILFTIFNPTFAPWWATVGYNMLGQGVKLGGILGLLAVILGHWTADLGWYALISFTVSKGSNVLLRDNIYSILKIVMSIFMLILSVLFFTIGLSHFLPIHIPFRS